MSHWWVFHEDKVDEAIKAWIDEYHQRHKSSEPARMEETVRDFLKSKALADLGMRLTAASGTLDVAVDAVVGSDWVTIESSRAIAPPIDVSIAARKE